MEASATEMPGSAITIVEAGPWRAVVHPGLEGRFCHFRLYRQRPGDLPPMLVASGTEERLADCVRRARTAVYAAGQAFLPIPTDKTSS